MSALEISQKILNDNQFIKTELDKFVTYYNLKHTVRWAKNRNGDITESVAEHVYGMHILCSYFLPLIDIDNSLNHDHIHSLITWHDMAEALVGDMTTVSKTDDHKNNEKIAEAEIVKSASSHIQTELQQVYDNYDDRNSPEASFVKALDKIESMFHLYFLSKKSINISAHISLEWEADKYREHREKYLRDFPLLKKFDDILYLETKDYFPNQNKPVPEVTKQ